MQKETNNKKTCIHCGENFVEEIETLALECIHCIATDYQE